MKGHDQSPGRNDSSHTVLAQDRDDAEWLKAELQRVRQRADKLEAFIDCVAGIDPNDCTTTELRGYVNSAKKLLD